MKFPAISLKPLALLVPLMMTACVSLAPDYQRPDLPVPAQLPSQAIASTQGGKAVAADSVASADWHDIVTDERLRQVIQRALDNNRDLRVAVANVDKARATYRVQRASQFPALNATAADSRVHTPATNTSNNVATTVSTYSAQLGISSFELDLWGRLSNLSEAAVQSYLQLEETQRSVRLSLISEVSTAWLTLAADQQQLQLAQQTLASRQRTLDLMTQAHALGAETGPDLASARGSLQTARASVASESSVVEQDRTALELLVGAKLPDNLLPDANVIADQASAAQLVSVPDNLSSTVLLQRPDVLAAEHTLIADNANIGAARAAFFPTISLTAAGGSASRSPDDLFTADSRAWSFAPSISLPIFDAGSHRATLDAKKAQQTADVATYEKTIQTAFSEVSNALSVRRHLAEQLDAQREFVAATEQRLQYSTALYKQGGGSYLDVLDAQRTLFSAQQTLISLRLAEQTNRITLFKVLGGSTRMPLETEAKR